MPTRTSDDQLPPARNALVPGTTEAHRSAVAPSTLPYTAVGYFEADGVRMAVLARGNAVLLKKRGDDVGSEFRLVVVDPPALLHLPTGAVLPVRHEAGTAAAPVAAATPASLLAPDPVIAPVQPAAAASDAEIAADIARALATPALPPMVGSSFPLAR